ncbi:MAG: acetate--CoA ligase family protein, partial [Actinomycetota bacterium]|nr:acetate--CoA ligase family protein [Actinomycetota bacterium]
DTGSRLLGAAGIAVVETVTCSSPDAAAAAADRLGYPVVAKVAHPDLVHKSDAGGVRVGLADASAVRAAAEHLLRLAPDARVLVQPEVAGLEVIVGGLRDPQFGAAVLVGLGGIHVEVLDDVAGGLAPLDLEACRQLLSGLRGSGLLGGVRSAPPVDVTALAEVVRAAGDLVASVPEIAELDLNPVLATPGGAVVVDWRIRVEFSPGQDEPAPVIGHPTTEN